MWRRLHWGPGVCQMDEDLLTLTIFFIISKTNFFKTFGKFRLHGERRKASVPAYTCNGVVRHSPTFHILLQLASAYGLYMLAGEGRISSNMVGGHPFMTPTKIVFDSLPLSTCVHISQIPSHPL